MKSLDQRISELEKKVAELEGQVPAQMNEKNLKEVEKDIFEILKTNKISCKKFDILLRNLRFRFEKNARI